jgi:hypothetical protein
MKKIITIFLIFIGYISYGQSITHNSISVVSYEKDTLYLVNEGVGYTIEEVWNEFYENEKPIIIMKSENWIVMENIRRKSSPVVYRNKNENE